MTEDLQKIRDPYPTPLPETDNMGYDIDPEVSDIDYLDVLENRDAVGVELKSFTRISGDGEDFYVPTDFVLHHINSTDEEREWDTDLVARAKSHEVELSEVLERADRKIEARGDRDPDWIQVDYTRNETHDEMDEQAHKIDYVCESISYGTGVLPKEISMSFIPSHINTSRVLSIYSKLEPIPVLQQRTDKMFKEHENIRYYAKEPLLEKMQENGYVFVSTRDGVHLTPTFDPKDPKDKDKIKLPTANMEQILQQLEPITAKPIWSDKEISLSHLYAGGKIRGTSNDFIKIDEKADKVTGSFPYTDIPTEGVTLEEHRAAGRQYDAIEAHREGMINRANQAHADKRNEGGMER